jgi:Undecaprenyl-phosphate galactose phosphotransferase WbaP
VFLDEGLEMIINKPEAERKYSDQTSIKFLSLRRYSRLWMGLALLISDMLALTLAGFLAFWLRTNMLTPVYHMELYPQLWLLLIIFTVLYAFRDLYPGIGMSPVEELRRLVVTTSLVFLFLTGATFWIRNAENYSRLIFGFAWMFALIFVQAGRWLTRAMAVKLNIWGEPVAIIGFGAQEQEIVEYLKNHRQLGLAPRLIIDISEQVYSDDQQITVLPIRDRAQIELAMKHAGIRTALLVIPEMPASLQWTMIEENPFRFRRLILLSSLGAIGSVSVAPYDLEGILGLEVRQNLLSGYDRNLKRLLEILLIIISSIVVLPLIILLSVAVRLDSAGPIFYRHKRIGMNGSEIKVWKFRTMVPDADQRLEEYLACHPGLRKEWESTQKLKKDPRVTRVGRFLRKTSLDELPQLINVVLGEMSLVGPRPIVDDEIKHYGAHIRLYQRVRPGITGLWQVSGRNDVGYALRVRLDEYYVRNWSIWLDIYILIRTIWVVGTGHGAY